MSGQAVSILKGSKIPIVSGSFVQSGGSIAFPVARKVSTVSGLFNLNGSDIQLTYKRVFALLLENGSLTFAGQQVRLLAARKLQALFGAEIISGSDIALEKLTKLLLGTDAITLKGFDVNLLKIHAPEPKNTIHSMGKESMVYSMEKNNRINAGQEEISDVISLPEIQDMVYSIEKNRTVLSGHRITGN